MRRRRHPLIEAQTTPSQPAAEQSLETTRNYNLHDTLDAAPGVGAHTETLVTWFTDATAPNFNRLRQAEWGDTWATPTQSFPAAST